ncbi:hypothetical protein HDU91_005618, partial [Kappamyces sp. JEL0680]
MLRQSLLFAAVLGAMVLESNWNRQDCGLAPSTMYLYDEQESDAAYTPFYGFVMDDGGFTNNCGYAPIGHPSEQCCFNSIDLAKSSGISSGSFWYLGESQSLSSSIPASANSQPYVRISRSSSSPDFAWTDLLVLCDDACTSQVKCYASNRTVEIFSGPGCGGRSAVYALSSRANLVQDDYFGNVTLAAFTSNQGTNKPSWFAIFPNLELVTNTAIWSDVLCNILLLVSIAATLVLLYLYIVVFLAKRNYLAFIDVVKCFFWLSTTVLWTLTSVLVLEVHTTYVILECSGISSNLSTLLSVQQTTWLLLTIAGEKRTWVCVLAYSFFTLVHIALCFPAYVMALFEPTPGDISSLVQVMYKWLQGRDVWLMFMMLYVLLPNIYLVLSITHAKIRNHTRQLWTSCRKDVMYSVLISSHIVNALVFVFLWVSLQFMLWPTNDRMYYFLMGGARTSSITLHFLLQWATHNHAKRLHREKKARKDNKKLSGTDPTKKSSSSLQGPKITATLEFFTLT